MAAAYIYTHVYMCCVYRRITYVYTSAKVYLYDHPAGDKEVGGGGERTRNGLANESLLTKDP